jgi:hypothetical protein
MPRPPGPSRLSDVRRLPLIVVGSVLVVVALAFAGVLLVGRGSAPVGPALSPITVQPQGPVVSSPAPDPGGTVPPPPARDADSDDDLDDDPDDDDDDD